MTAVLQMLVGLHGDSVTDRISQAEETGDCETFLRLPTDQQRRHFPLHRESSDNTENDAAGNLITN